MKVEWTPEGAEAAVTLGDDAAKHTIALEQLGAVCIEQVTPLFRAATPLRIPRANVCGDLVFTAAKSHGTLAAAAAFFAGELARVNQSGTVVLTMAANTTLTMEGAVLRSVVLAGSVGVRWWVRYTFGIKTVV